MNSMFQKVLYLGKFDRIYLIFAIRNNENSLVSEHVSPTRVVNGK